MPICNNLATAENCDRFTQIVSWLRSIAKVVIDVLICVRWPRVRPIRCKRRIFRVFVLVIVVIGEAGAGGAAAAAARSLTMRRVIVVVVIVAGVVVVALVGILAVRVVFVARFIGGIFAGAGVDDARGGDPWIFCARW